MRKILIFDQKIDFSTYLPSIYPYLLRILFHYMPIIITNNFNDECIYILMIKIFKKLFFL